MIEELEDRLSDLGILDPVVTINAGPDFTGYEIVLGTKIKVDMFDIIDLDEVINTAIWNLDD